MISVENIFKYDPDEQECKKLDLLLADKESYLQSASSLKKLNDLYNLFLMRNDEWNCSRVSEKIRECIAISWGEDYKPTCIINLLTQKKAPSKT